MLSKMRGALSQARVTKVPDLAVRSMPVLIVPPQAAPSMPTHAGAEYSLLRVVLSENVGTVNMPVTAVNGF